MNKSVRYPPSNEEIKSKPSFWNRILGLSRKSHIKDKKKEDCYNKQGTLHSSFRTIRPALQNSSNESSDEGGNFTTLECSAFLEVHKDAGILFLNKEPLQKLVSKEENKHVQFAPTPMNKYYAIDNKAAPSQKGNSDEDKENMDIYKAMKPIRPILRFEKNDENAKKDLKFGVRNKKVSTEKELVNVTYVEGPQVKKTPTFPRTSTKVTLFDRKNASLPQLNISNIARYGSLPRTIKAEEKSISASEFCTAADGNDTKESYVSLHKQYIPVLSKDRLQAEWHRRSLRNTNTYRQSCYGVSDPSRVIEQQTINHNLSTKTNFHRLSIGPNIMHSRVTDLRTTASGRFHKSMTSKYSDSNRSIQTGAAVAQSTSGQATNIAHKSMFWPSKLPEKAHRNTKEETKAKIPNKAINEIGLPVTTHGNDGLREKKGQTSCMNPHYIPLSEMYSKKNDRNKVPDVTNNTETSQNLSKCNVAKPYNLNPRLFSQENISGNILVPVSSCCNSTYDNRKQLTMKENISSSCKIDSSVNISENKKQNIKLALYSQKRKIVNKMCKYKAKETEEGFSSMADDECSFNCSCSSCESRLSILKKRNALRSIPQSKEKLFIRKNESDEEEKSVKEREVLGTIFEQTCAVDQVEPSSSTTWYECNDSLCKTPIVKATSEKETCTTPQTIKMSPSKQSAGSIYENITRIINSATKRNFKEEDIKRAFSTPLSKEGKIKQGVNLSFNGKTSRTLFPQKHGDNKPERNRDENAKFNTHEKSEIFFNDSIVLLQEIFQKLSQECRDLLHPCSSTSICNDNTSSDASEKLNTTTSKYANDIFKSLHSRELSEDAFADIIGGIAQNIFLETKAKRKVKRLTQSKSLPNLTQKENTHKVISAATSMRHICGPENNERNKTENNTEKIQQQHSQSGTSSANDTDLGSRQLPDGWSRTPTTDSTQTSNSITSDKTPNSGSQISDFKCTASELELLEKVIRVGMGLPPDDKVHKIPFYSASPAKSKKYKSKDVLSGKGKLKLKIYNNSGLVTVHVMRAAKLDWINGRELNSYVKVSMVPDEAKRVHWRTTVQKEQKNPVYNQKFSFELLDEDISKRLVFSTWHRDYTKQRSELIGCMSFSVRHVMDNHHNIDGWYRLLREGFGTQKHFAARTKKN
ncbi:uncharacterized protein LOC118182133 isoform X2 [Stegodyphus dumicola]|uniref:uncharacterized protein LOC118182133 isoform X2 n=1 Tax=Stegodyphus dumicola TaxID=202533 RepID=UPI0015A95B92|nr:uncharacterized protein LOC118182133 isoform X2 [Stegodyphus dumicola]